MSCVFDSRWAGAHGIGRFAKEIAGRLPHAALDADGRPMSPLDPLRLTRVRFGPGQWFLSPGYNAPLFSNAPYLLTVHDLNHIDRPDNSSVVKRLYYRLVLRRLCRRARAVLTVSEFSRRRIAEWFGLDIDRVFNVGNGVSEAFVPEGRRHDVGSDYVLCVSNRRGHKNEEGLMHAFARSALPSSLKLVLTGEPSENLEELARTLGVSGRVAFAGRVSEDELAALYRGALFLVFPSFYEGFGLPIIEAFACGTPVITSNVTSMPEIAGDAALLVDPHDVDAIAEAMVRLASSPELRKTLVARGYERIGTFSWDAVAERVKAAVAAVDTNPEHPLHWS
jgi:glycosyltransferase involved in cell wall biosynthesis